MLQEWNEFWRLYAYCRVWLTRGGCQNTPSVSHRADKNENTLGQQKEKCSPDISKDVGTSYKIFCTENFDKTTFFYKGNDGGW